jgi:hypothetical protein
MRPTDIIHIRVTFEDEFSGATLVKEVSRSMETFVSMQASIGQIVRRFENGISWAWRVIKIEQIGHGAD